MDYAPSSCLIMFIITIITLIILFIVGLTLTTLIFAIIFLLFAFAIIDLCYITWDNFPETKVPAVNDSNIQILEVSPTENKLNKRSDINLMEEGLGGMDSILDTIYRRVLAPRMLNPTLQEEMQVKQIKGIILYGKSGTGKTAIAKLIGKKLNCAPPVIVSGPSIKSMWIGKSEENIRNLFKPAMEDKSKLHLIILDEFDAIGSKRLGSETSSHDDSVVNQILSYMDGCNNIPNIILIALTNLKDNLDEALLRPGRFEVHIEVLVPDKQARVDIFNIYTRNLKKYGYLAEDVNIEELAELTEGYTGAEIEGLINNVKSFVILQYVDSDEFNKSNNPDTHPSSENNDSANQNQDQDQDQHQHQHQSSDKTLPENNNINNADGANNLNELNGKLMESSSLPKSQIIKITQSNFIEEINSYNMLNQETSNHSDTNSLIKTNLINSLLDSL